MRGDGCDFFCNKVDYKLRTFKSVVALKLGMSASIYTVTGINELIEFCLGVFGGSTKKYLNNLALINNNNNNMRQ